MVDRDLARAPYYHGLLPREDIKIMLKDNGDFLVRMTEPSEPGKREFVLSVMWDKAKDACGVKHFVIQRASDGKFSIEKTAQFESVVDLVNHFVKTTESITNALVVTIKTPVVRRAWQLDHCDVECTKKLGEGAFGEVHKGLWRNKKSGKKVDVAIKLAKLDVLTKEQIKEIMREARLMRYLDHPNIVRLYGVAAGQEPLMLVMELASNGALDSYLQKNNCTKEKKSEMCLQAAWGLEYLHERSVMHRDIASRNCLYGDNKVKISDFGLSRTGTFYQMNPKCKVPIRWLAPETLRTATYNQCTDVWSYGIMCWEIFHNGQEPYPGMSVAEMNSKVRDGYRMTFADVSVAPELVRLIEQRCWAELPQERFQMADIARVLERVVGQKKPNASQSNVSASDGPRSRSSMQASGMSGDKASGFFKRKRAKGSAGVTSGGRHAQTGSSHAQQPTSQAL